MDFNESWWHDWDKSHDNYSNCDKNHDDSKWVILGLVSWVDGEIHHYAGDLWQPTGSHWIFWIFWTFWIFWMFWIFWIFIAHLHASPQWIGRKYSNPAKKKGLLTGRLLMELVGPFNQLKWIKNMPLLLLMNDAADFPLNAFDAFY